MYDALNIIRYLTFCFVLLLNLQGQMESGNNETRGFLTIEMARRGEEGRGKILQIH